MGDVMLQRLAGVGALTLSDAHLKPLAIEGYGTLPVIELPAGALAFDDKTGFWVSLALVGEGSDARLVGQIHPFDLAQGKGDWAIPMAYEPEDERQAVMQALGFDEGWELSAGGPFFVLTMTAHARKVLTLAQEQGRLVLTVTGGKSLFPMSLVPRAAQALAAALEA